MRRLTLYISGILAALLAFSSCAVKYTRPDVNAVYRDIDTNYAHTDTCYNIADISWRDYYYDSTLFALIDSALVNNHDMKVALKRLEQSAAYFKQSKWAYAPTLGASANARYSKSSIGGNESPYFTLGVNASWEVDIWGKLTKAKRAKFEQMLAQEDTRNAIQTQIVAEVATAYYTLIALDKQREYSLETIATREEYYRTVLDLKEAAKVNEIAVLQAEVQLVTARGFIIEVDQSIRATENMLCLLLGIPSQSIYRPKYESLSDIDFDTFESAGLPAQLLLKRPDVMAAEHKLKASLHSYNSAVAAQYPSLTISGNISSDATEFAKWFSSPASLIWGVVGGLTQPILNGRALRTQKEVARLDYEIAEEDFRYTVLSAATEVSNILYDIEGDKKNAILLRQKYEALRKAYEYSVEMMIANYATYLDVLTAQEGVFSAQNALIKEQLELIKGHINLYRALGGGWDQPKQEE